MKKLTGLLLLSLCLVLPACKKPEEEPVPTGTEYGPIVEEDERTDEEKQLAMIQNCISDYNTGRISEVEDYLDTTLHPLPIGVTSLPEISSLKDLTPEPDYMENSNVSYAGSYAIDYSGEASSVTAYYEPDVDLVVQLVDEAGNVLPIAGIEQTGQLEGADSAALLIDEQPHFYRSYPA